MEKNKINFFLQSKFKNWNEQSLDALMDGYLVDESHLQVKRKEANKPGKQNE